jgi:hypothetical protein
LIEGAASNPNSTTRDCSEIKTGQSVRHGENYIVKVDGRRMNKRKDTPLDTLDITLGKTSSPHIVVGDAVLYAATKGDIEGVLSTALRGPTIVAKGPFELTHATHPTAKFPKGVFQVLFQADAQTLRRVED